MIAFECAEGIATIAVTGAFVPIATSEKGGQAGGLAEADATTSGSRTCDHFGGDAVWRARLLRVMVDCVQAGPSDSAESIRRHGDTASWIDASSLFEDLDI